MVVLQTEYHDTFEEVYELLNVKLMAYIRVKTKILPAYSSIEDISQIIWLRVFSKWDSFTLKDDHEWHQKLRIAWVYRVAHNIIVDFIRSNSLSRTIPSGESMLKFISNLPRFSIDHNYDITDEEYKLSRILAEICINKRDVLIIKSILMRMDGYSWEEISNILGVYAATAYKNMAAQEKPKFKKRYLEYMRRIEGE